LNDLAFAILCYHVLLVCYLLKFSASDCYWNEFGLPLP